MMQIDDIEDILLDGTIEQLKSLPKGVSYKYDPDYHSIHIRYGKMNLRGYGEEVPNCVRHFGNEHTF